MSKSVFPLVLTTTISLVIATTSRASAIIINGNFADNLTSWQPIGNATSENQQALITSDGVSTSDLEAFLGLTTGSLNGLGNGAVNRGSAIQQTFTANTGDVLTFDWNFLTNEPAPSEDGVVNDFAFYTLSSSATELADASSNFPGSPTELFARSTGFQTLAPITLASSGSYTLGFGVVDVDSPTLNSGLLVDNVALSSTPVPFEFSPGLGILALGACSVMARLKSTAYKSIKLLTSGRTFTEIK